MTAATAAWGKHLNAMVPVIGKDNALVGFVVKNPMEYATADQALQLGRSVKLLFAEVTKKSEEQRERERNIAEGNKTIDGTNKMIRNALGEFKRAEKARVEEEARVAAQKEFDRIEREKQAEAARLEKLAKKAKGQEKKDLKAQAEEVREEPVQSVESAVSETVQQSQSSLKGASVKLWRAEVENLTELVLWVAENPEDRIDYIQPHLVHLNGRARMKKRADIGIPGVVGISEDSYR